MHAIDLGADWRVPNRAREATFEEAAFISILKMIVFLVNSFLMVWLKSGYWKLGSTALSNLFICASNSVNSGKVCPALVFNLLSLILHLLSDSISDFVSSFSK